MTDVIKRLSESNEKAEKESVNQGTKYARIRHELDSSEDIYDCSDELRDSVKKLDEGMVEPTQYPTKRRMGIWIQPTSRRNVEWQ